MELNDMDYSPDWEETREQMISRIFQDHDIEVEFVNESPIPKLNVP